MGKIILGSSSPRRADILTKLNLDFEIFPSSYAEPHDKTDFSYEFVENLAYNKGVNVISNHPALSAGNALCKDGINTTDAINEKILVVSADTIVVINNRILGKPKDRSEAFYMLKMLSGRTHFVVTSIAVINPANMKYRIKSTTTYVTFENLTDGQINYYITNFKPFDKAGAYGIQELPAGCIKNVEGELDNVIGMPSKTLLELLQQDYK